jgi:hypothetical protein
MDDPDPFELGTYEFTGVVKIWRDSYGELTTNSGVTVLFVTQGFQPVPEGTRITIVTRKFRQRYQIERAFKAE